MNNITPKAGAYIAFALATSLVLLASCGDAPGSRSTPSKAPATPTPVPGSYPSSNGAMARANIQGTGVYDSAPVRQPPHEIFTSKTGTSHPDSVPAVVSGTAYFGTYNDTLYAVDVSTGSELWHFKPDYGAMYSPSVVGSTTYVSTSDENLYALDGATGRELWRFSIQDTSKPFAIFSDPVIDAGVLYAGCTRDAFFALDAATGQVKWRIDVSGWASAPALANGTLYFGGRSVDGRSKNYIYAVDESTGQEKWKVPVQPDGLQDTPAVAGGMVFASTWREGLIALDAATGKKKWQYAAGSAILTSPAVAYDTVYITDDGSLIALDMATGQQKWTIGDGGFATTAPVIAGDVVYFASTSPGLFIPFITQPDPGGGHIYAVDAQSGRQLWSHKVKGTMSYSPAIYDATLYYGDDAGYFHALR